MAKAIAVSEEVYTLLKRAKRTDESFSRVIKRSLKSISRLSDIAGSKTISVEDWKAVKNKIKKAESITISELTGR